MRPIPSPPAPGPEPIGGRLTMPEVIVVVVVVVAAAALAARGMPVTGALTFIIGALGVAAHCVWVLRGPQAPPPDTV